MNGLDSSGNSIRAWHAGMSDENTVFLEEIINLPDKMLEK